MTAIRHQSAALPSTQDAGGHDGPLPRHHLENGASPDRHDLARILAFLRHEIDQSAMALSDIADRLSKTLCALASEKDQSSFQSNLAEGAIALQREDRIQQRLSDLVAVLVVLERTMADGQPTAGDSLAQTIIDKLRLEEMRHAFAVANGMTSALDHAPNPAAKPSVGDIDLF